MSGNTKFQSDIKQDWASCCILESIHLPVKSSSACDILFVLWEEFVNFARCKQQKWIFLKELKSYWRFGLEEVMRAIHLKVISGLYLKYRWEEILDTVKCTIISFKKNDYLDAYVLSESSMFVSKNRLILKTCGSTTLLKAVEVLILVVMKFTEFDTVLDLFYSRKNFMHPELQEKPHTSFQEETELLDKLFPSGSAYCLGRINRDCWYLYTLNPLEKFIGVQVPDQTLEVIMQELDPKIMKIFTKEGYYCTIHITPQPQFSYVSFETNYPQDSYSDLINRLVKVFHPGKFMMTLFVNKLSVASLTNNPYNKLDFRGFCRKELQFSQFKNYDLTYARFAKAPS
ncbi:s-adenosylmethionine decarboxylase proenzyme [Caerostris extrusa]|uniref:S-adenosylmethionine decarboxylase proenzyme n=1 Tax=Caerostris extrusa TaxID=172846 RepID=A0AAV4WLY2_CAEEX|nr:s-adenosylmethionine decarboxylase proenzyme [Caerostris extrusa]